ncbi:MAG: PSD1 and planctomycete cytochrome C domain-containing protein [Planctomycetales bacterium]
MREKRKLKIGGSPAYRVAVAMLGVAIVTAWIGAARLVAARDPGGQAPESAGNSSSEKPPAAAVDFARDVRPIFAARCYECHGPETQESGLRFDQRGRALQGGDSGEKAIVAGKPDDSEMIRRVRGDEPGLLMPPEGEPLAKEQIDILVRWVRSGAEWPDEVAAAADSRPEHWAYRKPVRPAPPAVKHEDRVRNPIDRFVLAKLEQEGIAPSPEADRQRLIRRVALDLTGLPPTIAQVDAFLSDDRPDAYERVVDRLLGSPAYGERWARVWLDLARYADSCGYGTDYPREIWRYRDWVIEALNANKPFDEFTIEQIAGDLLPNPTLDQRIATAFHRNTMTNIEGGTDDEEFRVAAVVDRVNTTMQVWMGTTMACAQCHTHKYDPITQREYYEFFAFFNNTADRDREDEAPTMPSPTPAQAREQERLKSEIARLEAVLAQVESPRETPLPLREGPGEGPPQTPLPPREGSGEGGDSADQPATHPLPPPMKGGEWQELATLSRIAKEKRKKEQQARLDELLAQLDDAAKQRLDEWNSRQDDLAAIRIPTTPVMVELEGDKRRKTHVMIRGSFLARGEEVAPGTPAAFHPFPKGAPRDRLGLARWLVDPDNPLTARVMVNRLWEQYFGVGLVETSEDFGTQGDPPSHPELLDWLATEFIRTGWDMKAMHRLIVTSNTYRQSSVVGQAFQPADAPERPSTPGRLESLPHPDPDPRNRLLARGPRLRLEAEMVRDQALAASGLLSRKMLGPSVKPPQPEGLWMAAFDSRYRTWATSTGEDRYRRGVYTFLRRTIPYPSMIAFDAPTREVCTVRRSRTNTPLQALVTLNDPVYVEAAQALARRIVREGGSDVRERAAFGFRVCVARPPEPRELDRLEAALAAQLAHYRAHPDEAAKMATSVLGPAEKDADLAELAAWTVIANVLLNLDETLTK